VVKLPCHEEHLPIECSQTVRVGAPAATPPHTRIICLPEQKGLQLVEHSQSIRVGSPTTAPVSLRSLVDLLSSARKLFMSEHQQVLFLGHPLCAYLIKKAKLQLSAHRTLALALQPLLLLISRLFVYQSQSADLPWNVLRPFVLAI
jgi:hypothetical protein